MTASENGGGFVNLLWADGYLEDSVGPNMLTIVSKAPELALGERLEVLSGLALMIESLPNAF